MKQGHQNLCDHAEDEGSLYRLWDADLRKYISRRQWCEFGGFALLLLAYYAYRGDKQDWAFLGLALAVVFLYSSIKYMIDESNINYLMHLWDLTDAIAKFRWQERRKLNGEI
jgi:hypothetical protein